MPRYRESVGIIAEMVLIIEAPYVSSDANPQFKWEAYNLSTKEWTTIQDWSESNQTEWHGEIWTELLDCIVQYGHLTEGVM